MSGRKLRSIAFLVFVFLLAFSFIGCGDQGGTPSSTPTPPPSGSWRGTQQFGTNLDDIGRAVTVDSSGNIYITGSTGGSLATTSFGGLDVFLAKFDPTGNLLFIEQFGSNRDDIGYGVALDSSGNIFIVGSTAGSIFPNTSSGGLDVFLAKFDPTGNLLFIEQFGSNLDDVGRGLAFDSSGSVLITGATGGSMPGNTSFGGVDAFLAKFSSSGGLLFIEQFGSNLDDIGYGIGVDSSGNVLIAGATGGSMPGNISLGGVDAFLAKFGSLGNVLFIEQFGSNLDDIGRGLAFDSSGNVLVIGSTGGTLVGNISSGGLDVFLFKFSPSGTVLFIGQFGSNLDDIGYGVAVDSSGNILMTGSTGGSMPNNVSFGGVDVFLARSDTSGILRIQQFGSNLDDIGYGLAIDSSANVFITGSTGGILGASSKGQLDAFLVKFNSAGVKQ